MGPIVQLALAVLPGPLWLLWLRRKDRPSPEPAGLLASVALLGAASGFAALQLRHFAEVLAPAGPLWLVRLIDAFVVTALFEETLKSAAVVVGSACRGELDRPVDGLLHGVAAGIGFASFENAVFIRESGDLAAAVLRAFTVFAVHVGCTGMFGHAWSRARRAGRWSRIPITMTGIVLLHGAYDACVFAWPELARWALLVLLPLVMLLFVRTLRRAEWQSAPAAPSRTRPGETAGSP